MFILNFISFYFQSTLLVLLPNIILLILYVLINNITVYKGYVQVSESPIDFTHYVSKLNTKDIKDHGNSSINFPYEYDYHSLLRGEINDSSFLQNKSSFERENLNPVPIKCLSVPTTPSTTVAISCNNAVTFSNTVTTSYTNCLTSQTFVPTTTTCTFSSNSPVCTLYGVSLTPQASAFSTTDFVSTSDSSKNSVFLSKSDTHGNLEDVKNLMPFDIDETESFSSNSSIQSQVSSETLNFKESIISEHDVSNKCSTFSDILNQEPYSFQSEKNISDEKISIEKPAIVDPTINSEINSKSNLSILEIRSMLEILPKFKGDLKDYKFFKEKFKILVEHQNINSCDKAYLLYSSLSDEVLAILGQVTEKGFIDYQSLWDNLDSEFSLPQNGQFYFSNALFSLGSWPICNTLESLTRLYKFILSNYLGLERERVQESGSIYGMKILSILEGELAYNVSLLLSSDISKTAILPKILQLLKQEIRFLEINRLAQATKDGIHVKFENIENKNGEISHCEKDHSENQQNLVKDACVFCKSMAHLSIHCNFYSRPRDYYSSLFEQFRCFNCFHKGHKSFNCSQSKLCNLCNDPRPHSPIICNNNRNIFH